MEDYRSLTMILVIFCVKIQPQMLRNTWVF